MHFIHFENTTPEVRINVENIFAYYPKMSRERYINTKDERKHLKHAITHNELILELYTNNIRTPLELKFKSRESLVDALKILDASTDLITVEYKEKPKEDESILKC